MLLGGTGFAQTVQVFDDAPSIEQLRNIMIPESQPGLGRTIVIQRPDMGPAQTSVQRASTEVLPVPLKPVASAPAPAAAIVKAAASAPLPAAPVVKTAAAVSVAPPPPTAKTDAAAEAGAVAFHVNFAFDSAAMPDQARPMMDMIVQLMKEAPEIKVRVEGHTDAAGSARYNVSLSERRALSVGEYLASQGIDPSRLILVGKGMAEPLTRDPYDASNRRVQFVRVS
ncbi:MAG TPA: OmpA family protein [Rhodopila sp.]